MDGRRRTKADYDYALLGEFVRFAAETHPDRELRKQVTIARRVEVERKGIGKLFNGKPSDSSNWRAISSVLGLPANTLHHVALHEWPELLDEMQLVHRPVLVAWVRSQQTPAPPTGRNSGTA